MSGMRCYRYGDHAVVLAAQGPPSLACQQRLWTLAERVRTWPQVEDVVPGMNNLTLICRPLRMAFDELTHRLRAAWMDAEAEALSGREVDIPVDYGGEHGPDLEEVARLTGLTAGEVVSRHAGGDYVVFFLGFLPGFAYLGGLDPRLHVPRRATPRLSVPAGSVGIGGAQTGIYPLAVPGGWQLIGRTCEVLFDPTRTPPTLLAPGDRVRFRIASVRP